MGMNRWLLGVGIAAAIVVVTAGMAVLYGGGAKLTPAAAASWASATAAGKVDAAPVRDMKVPLKRDYGYVILATRRLKESMRDPDSFKLESAFVIDGSGEICYKYRAHNGFGGVNVGYAVYSKIGLFTDETSSFRSMWNKVCAGKSGKELAVTLNMVGDLKQ